MIEQAAGEPPRATEQNPIHAGDGVVLLDAVLDGADGPEGLGGLGGLGGAEAHAQRSMEREISGSLLRLRAAAPFFATLALHAQFTPRQDIPTAATDGRNVMYNPAFLAGLSRAELDGVLLHEVLHAALAHVARRDRRDPKRWNVAADIVVNGLVTQNGFELPEGAIRDAALEGYSVEEIYALLPRQAVQHELADFDLIDPQDVESAGAGGQPGGEKSGSRHSGRAQGEGGSGDDAPGDDAPGDGAHDGSLNDSQRKAVERHWRKAVAHAASVGRSSAHGALPAGVERAFGLRPGTSSLDWRALLWRFLSRADADYGSFDRRFAHRGLYLETLDTQVLRVYVCIDSSGSIEEPLVADLLAEAQAILRAYPTLDGWLWFADAEAYGPWKLEGDGPLPAPVGGGGTDFCPFFEAVAERERTEIQENAVCVYLTDGYGSFPEVEPRVPVLWVVTPGGLDDEGFPFGTVTRMAP